MRRRLRRIVHITGCLTALILAPVCRADAATDILFLRGNLEISFGQPAPLDETLVEKLEAAGYRVHVARDFHPLTDDYLRQFHTVVWVGISPGFAEGRLFTPANWQGGLHLLTVRDNAAALRRYVEHGGGLLLNPSVDEMGMQIIPSHRRVLSDYGMDIAPAQMRDPERQFVFHKVIKTFPYHIAWTEAIGDHPVTDGVSRIYYPAYTMRWDDNFTTLPLYPRDPSWTVLAAGASGSRVSWFRGTPFEHGHWKDDPDAETPAVLAAVREYGKGRVGVIGIGHYHLFYFPYSETPNFWEVTFGPQKGILMTEGDGETPADLERMMFQLYAWLSEPARTADFGFDPDEPVPLPEIVEPRVDNLGAVWAQHDPLRQAAVRPMRILVGARTRYSDGHGTPADYAAAAKAAGYDVIAFTETFEALTRDGFREFVAECRRHSDQDVHLLPGIDVADSLGNRFLLLGKDTPIRDHLLVETEDDEPGDRLIWTGHMLLGMGEVLPVPARPQHLATVRDRGALPPELYSHFAGIAVATYRNGELVDDGLSAYRWQLFNASLPIPLAIHEVYSPDEVAAAAGNGLLQTMVNGDTPERVATYFRQGFLAAGGNPFRTYVSSGPVPDSYGIADWQAEPWHMSLEVAGEQPITDIRVHDQRRLYRHFRPQSNRARVSWHGDLGAQHWFLTDVTDAGGGRLILAPVRTLPGARAFVRCLDRQNWFSGLGWRMGVTYTGRMRSMPKPGIAFAVPGVQLPGNTLCPKLHLTYNGDGHTVVEYVVDGVLLPDGRDPGADASPIFNHLPINAFTGRFRNLYYMRTQSRSGAPVFTVTENSIEIHEELSPTGLVWPVLHRVDAATYRYWSAEDGNWIEGTVGNGETRALPAGARVGTGTVLLDAVNMDDAGRLGPAADDTGQSSSPGTRHALRFTTINPAEEEKVMTLMGFGEALPYAVEVSQGEFLGAAFALRFRAQHDGVAGTLRGAAGEELPQSFPGPDGRLAAELHDGNPNWPLGVWTAEDDTLIFYQYLDDSGRGRLPVNRDTAFYFGSLITADDPRLALHFAEPWTAAQAVIEVHNPTAGQITATVRTAAAVNTRRQLEQEIAVPAGATVLIGR